MKTKKSGMQKGIENKKAQGKHSQKKMKPKHKKLHSKKTSEDSDGLRHKLSAGNKVLMTEINENGKGIKLPKKKFLSQKVKNLTDEVTFAETAKTDVTPVNKTKTKRKRCLQKEEENSCKRMKLDIVKQKTASEQSTGGPAVLSRKQKRNRKKNNSKKNKYKHLALSAKDQLITDSETISNSSSLKSSSNDSDISKSNAKTQPPVKQGSVKKDKAARSVSKKSKVSAAVGKFASQKQKSVIKLGIKKKKKPHVPSNTHVIQNENGSEFSDSGDDIDSMTGKSGTSESESESSQSPERISSIATNEEKSIASTNNTKKRKTLSAVEKAYEQLKSARFRYLNEQLYTQTGDEAWKMFQDDPEAFQVYHAGFQTQVARWPVNPLDEIIKQLSQISEKVTIADFGCGDGHLAESLPQNRVHSFDLVSTKPFITACDIAKVPLAASSVNVVVFCLSLMGTNLSDYLREANRVLEKGGLLKIAEVVSRFYNIKRFIKNIEALGFQLKKKDCLSKMFLLMTFKKVDSPQKQTHEVELKPCQYKRR